MVTSGRAGASRGKSRRTASSRGAAWRSRPVTRAAAATFDTTERRGYAEGMGPGGQHRGARPGGLPPWAWAVVLSVGAHLVLLALLIVVRRPTLQLPVTPPPDAAARGTVLRVGVVSHGGAVGGTPEEPAAGLPLGAPPAVRRPRAGEGTAVEAPEPAAEVEPSVEGAARRDDTTTHSESGAVEDGVVGTVAAGTVAGDNAAGGTVAAGNVAAGNVAGGTVAGGNVAGAGGATSGAPGADVVGLVHARLAAGAERCYPAAARRYQQRGTAEVRFCVDASGQGVTPALVKTSGSSLLDAAVGGCVLPAASPFPGPAQGHCFTVPVRFGCK